MENCNDCDKKEKNVVVKDEKCGILYYKYWCFHAQKWVFFKVPAEQEKNKKKGKNR